MYNNSSYSSSWWVKVQCKTWISFRRTSTGKEIILDLSDAYRIDHTVMEFIDHFRGDTVGRGGRRDIRGLAGPEL
ncbi:protein of unknown function (plasmid) [Candidatus Methylocalor cossyra]|uniref:DUF4325 domain-containing protein n=1 Tax=Candidatus Methylocalor cossyra TaxID=3108543 RepID=A0ABP1CCV0_9GAMM